MPASKAFDTVSKTAAISLEDIYLTQNQYQTVQLELLHYLTNFIPFIQFKSVQENKVHRFCFKLIYWSSDKVKVTEEA